MTKSQEIEEYLISKIEENEYLKGERLPSENELAETFEVSRMTARKAIDRLEIKGFITRMKGRGTFVRDEVKRDVIYLDEVVGFTKRARRSGREPKTKIVEYRVELPNEEVSTNLKIGKREEVIYIERLRYIDGEPVVFETTYMPKKLFKDIDKKDLEESKYNYIEDRLGLKIEEIVKEYSPLLPSEKIRGYLEIAKNTPIFKTTLTGYLKGNKPFEFTQIYYNQEKYRFLQKIKK